MKRLVVLLVLLVLGGSGYAGWWYWKANANHGPAFRTAAVERGTLKATIQATGTIEPEEVIDIGAQIVGQIKSFGKDPRDSKRMVDFGSPVEQGTVLAQIDDSLYATQVDQAKANLQLAKANMLQLQAKLTQAERDWHRAEHLGPQKAIAGVDYDTALATYESAKSMQGVGDAQVAQAEAALKQATINLSYCTIRSPVKGVIVDRRVNVGQTVVSSLNAPSLFLLAKDLKRLQIWASVNEADIGNVFSGQTVVFAVDAFPNRKFNGVVAPDNPRLNATMTQNVVTYTVVVNTDNSDLKLKPYMTANVEFEVSKHDNTLLVANSALRWQPRRDQVAPEFRDTYVRGLRGKAGADGSNGAKPAANTDADPRHEHARLWVEDNGYVRPIKVRIGLTDGMNTEIFGDDVKEGLQAVVGEQKSAGGGFGSSNPFAPQMFGGGKKG
jgi:HlyD family secretion protein